MAFDPAIHRRRSIRLRGYDYSRPGAYFVTICTEEKRHLFGEVVEGELVLNEAGQMVGEWWLEVPRKFAKAGLDCAVVMPNHVHAIVRIVGADPCVRPSRHGVGADLRVRPTVGAHTRAGAHIGAPLHRIVQWFKTMTTNDYLRRVRDNGWPSLPGKLWQRNYYEHIIRNDDELNKIRDYIRTNPLRWNTDPENV